MLAALGSTSRTRRLIFAPDRPMCESRTVERGAHLIDVVRFKPDSGETFAVGGNEIGGGSA